VEIPERNLFSLLEIQQLTMLSVLWIRDISYHTLYYQYMMCYVMCYDVRVRT
jgi:hypothetical protein